MEKALKNEIMSCHKYLKLSLDDILKMTVMDRKTFISLHNKMVEKEKREMDMSMKRK